MTNEDVTRLYEQSFVEVNDENGIPCKTFSKFVFAWLIAQHEREACAEICDRFQARDVGMQPAECAGAIRARGQA